MQLFKDVRYLGLTLEKGLIWKKQLDRGMKKVYRAFWTCRGMFGKMWGLKLKFYTECTHG
jgi:hypothetical protein